jgi:hypothetical protein
VFEGVSVGHKASRKVQSGPLAHSGLYIEAAPILRMVAETEPATRDDIEVGEEYSGYHMSISAVSALVKEGDLVRFTRTSDAPAPEAVVATLGAPSGFVGECQRGFSWTVDGDRLTREATGETVTVQALVVERMS